MKAVKKYLAVMLSIFMIASVCPAVVYASPEEGDMAEEEMEAIIPEEPSALDAGGSSEEALSLDIDRSLEEAAYEIEEEVPEEIVGDGVQLVQVGDGVTATFDPNTGKVVFYSSGGTLWNDWRSKSGFETSQIKSISSTGKLYLPADSSGLFVLLTKLASLDMSQFDTSNVTDMNDLFSRCSSLINLDLSSFDTSKVTDMNGMFGGCSSLTNLDLSRFDTSNVTDMGYMFSGCTNLEILSTPQKHTARDVTLPLTMYDTAGKAYTELPMLSKSIILGATQKIAHDYMAEDVTTCAVTLTVSTFIYDGKAKEPVVTVKDGNKVFKLV